MDIKTGGDRLASSMTMRERIAMEFESALLAQYETHWKNGFREQDGDFEIFAIRRADALIEALEQ